MKKLLVAFLACVLLYSCALADTAPAKMDVPPQAIATQAEGELETYDLEFPADMPLEAKNFVLLARAQFEKIPLKSCPRQTNILSGIIRTSVKLAGARSSRFTVRSTAACS